MLPTAKSMLLKKLEGGMVTIEKLPSNYCMIIRGMAAVRQLKASGMTYREVAEKLLKSVVKTVKNGKELMWYSTFIWIILSKMSRETGEVTVI